MARYHAKTVPVLKSWDEVNESLRDMALEELSLMDIQGDMEKQIIGLKKVAEITSKPHADRIARIARDVEEYVTAHKEELGKSKTMTLTFGECGFRRSTKVVVPTAKEKLSALINRLRGKDLSNCIIVKETVDKTALRQQGKAVVLELGAKWVEKDTFWCEPAREKLERSHSGQL